VSASNHTKNTVLRQERRAMRAGFCSCLLISGADWRFVISVFKVSKPRKRAAIISTNSPAFSSQHGLHAQQRQRRYRFANFRRRLPGHGTRRQAHRSMSALCARPRLSAAPEVCVAWRNLHRHSGCGTESGCNHGIAASLGVLHRLADGDALLRQGHGQIGRVFFIGGADATGSGPCVGHRTRSRAD
jgi:hypothetical protein